MGQIVLPLIFVFSFLGAVILVQALVGAVFANRERSQRINRRMALLDSGMNSREVYETLVRRPAGPQFANLTLARLYDDFATYVRQAGMAMTPARIAVIALGAGTTLAFVTSVLLRAVGTPIGPVEMTLSLVGGLGLSTVGAWVWVSWRRNRRLKQIEEQLPLALDIVIRALRAGHPVVAAVQLVTEEMGDPIGSEFGLIVDETNYGVEFRTALSNFAHRTGSEDAHFFAVSVGIQWDTGGNLAEILTNLSGVIRARIMLGRRVRALSSEGRMSGVILSALPALLISFLSMTQPQFYTSKFDHPVFWPIAGVIAVLYLGGLVMMHRIINFKY